MYCGKCGQEIPDHSVFCGKCGARQKGTENKNLYGSDSDRKAEPDAAKGRKIIRYAGLLFLLLLVIGNAVSRNHKSNSEDAVAEKEAAVTPAVIELVETPIQKDTEVLEERQDQTIQKDQTEAETKTEAGNQAESKTEKQQNTIGEQDLKNLSVGSEVFFGTYEQDGNSSNGAEPIKWIVIDKIDDGYLMISKYILDCGKYYGYTMDRWEHAALRTWLNGTFYNTAFTQTEKNRMLTIVVTDPYDYEWGVADTIVTDPVFILSWKDVENYFPSEDKRRTRPTEYVRNKGLRTYDDGYCSWWVREDIAVSAWKVDHLGDIREAPESDEYGIRPVICLAFDS